MSLWFWRNKYRTITSMFGTCCHMTTIHISWKGRHFRFQFTSFLSTVYLREKGYFRVAKTLYFTSGSYHINSWRRKHLKLDFVRSDMEHQLKVFQSFFSIVYYRCPAIASKHYLGKMKLLACRFVLVVPGIMSVANKCFILFVCVCVRLNACVCVCTSVWKTEDNAGEAVFFFYIVLRRGLLCFCLTENWRWAGPQASRQINLSPLCHRRNVDSMDAHGCIWRFVGILSLELRSSCLHGKCISLWVWIRALWSPLQNSMDLEEDVRLVGCNSSSTSCCQNTSADQFYLKHNAPALCDLGRSSLLLFSVLTNAPSTRYRIVFIHTVCRSGHLSCLGFN